METVIVMEEPPLELEWHRFTKLTAARSKFATTACIYIQTDPRGCPLRIGKASEGLEVRYRGGTGYAIDAAMHGSGNFVYVAAVPLNLCGQIEDELIWEGRLCLTYNNYGKITPPLRRLPITPSGTPPKLEEFETV